MQGLYSEDYIILLKEIIADLTRKRNLCLQIRRFTVLEMVILPKLTYIFSTILIKIPTLFFSRNCKTAPTINMKMQEPQKSQNNLDKEQSLEDSYLSNFKTYYKVIVNQDSEVWA